MQIRMLQLSKEKYFIFQFSFDFNQSFCTRNEVVLQNMYSSIVIISALRVKFYK